MNSDLYFDGKKFISSSRAAQISGYANDYIGQLCRGGKLDCRMVGRSWYVSFDSLHDHQKSNVLASKNRNKKSLLLTPSVNSQFEENQSASEVNAVSEIETPISSSSEKTSETSEIVPVPVTLAPLPISSGFSESDNLSTRHRDTHHKKFAIQFPNLVAGTIALLLSLASFQTLLTLNPQAEIAYQNFGNELRNSMEMVSDVSAKEISANVFSGIRVPLDKLALNFYLSVNDFLFDTRTRIFVMLGRDEMIRVETVSVSENLSSQNGQGMVVVPVDEKTDKDAVIAKIQNSFSDEVQVAPRADGASGVITPVFKKINNDEYLYVLVPIKN